MKFLLIALLVMFAFGYVAVAVIGIAFEIIVWLLAAGVVLLAAGWVMRKISGGAKRLR